MHFLWLEALRAPKTDAHANCGRLLWKESGGCPLCTAKIAVPFLATDDFLVSRIWPKGVGTRRSLIIRLVVPVMYPFCRVARHVEQSVEAGARRIGTDLGRIPDIVVDVGQGLVWGVIAPGVGAVIGPFGCAFPFRFRGQTAVRPGTIGIRAEP